MSEPNYHTIKFFTENLLATEVRKTPILMEKAAYLGFWILDLYKTVMYGFWYDYIKLKYGENAKLCDVDTDYIYKNNAEDDETRLDTSNFELDKQLAKWKNKKVIGLMNDKLGGKIIKEFVVLRLKTYSYLADNNDEDKKGKGTKSGL